MIKYELLRFSVNHDKKVDRCYSFILQLFFEDSNQLLIACIRRTQKCIGMIFISQKYPGCCPAQNLYYAIEIKFPGRGKKRDEYSRSQSE
jgi:hypothetical protein